MKLCSSCHTTKSDDHYSSGQYKLNSGICKSCYNKQYRLNNLERLRKNERENKKRKYHQNTDYRTSLLEVRKKYYLDNKKNKLNYNKKYYADNRNKVLQSVKNYSLNNKDKIKTYHNNYYKNLRNTNINFKLKSSISASINFYINKNKKSTLKYLNYTIDQLRLHLESRFEFWMNWDNYGKYNPKVWDDNNPMTWTWQIDHIKPHSMFKYISMEDEEFKQCWSLDNLRPYSSKKNFIDGVTRVRHQ